MVFKRDLEKAELKTIYQQILLMNELDHPNIIKLYEYFEDARFIYLIFDYMKDGSLSEILQKKRQLSETQAADFLKNILEGINYLHNQDIIHKNMTPENIQVSGNSVKLVGFDLAVKENIEIDVL